MGGWIFTTANGLVVNCLSLQFISEFVGYGGGGKSFLYIGKWLQMVIVTACLQSLVIDKSEIDA